MTAIVADDEHLSRILMKKLLEEQEIEVVGESESGADALEKCLRLKPDLLFCDIRMPDLNGLETAAALTQFEDPPLLIFVTGYSDHAAEAFEKAAFDYLLKPVQRERLRLSLERSRRRLSQAVTEIVLPVLKRLPIRTEYALRLLKVDEIVSAVTKQKRVHVLTASEEFKTNYTLTQLEQMLPGELFMRVHASAIVKLDEIQEINFLGNHTYDVRLASGQLIPVGRLQYADLQKRLGL
jgi:two-component system LytT family response regulator